MGATVSTKPEVRGGLPASRLLQSAKSIALLQKQRARVRVAAGAETMFEVQIGAMRGRYVTGRVVRLVSESVHGSEGVMPGDPVVFRRDQILHEVAPLN